MFENYEEYTYADIDTANTIMEGELNSNAWDLATNIQRIKALITATRYLDLLNFMDAFIYDDKTDSEIPDDFKYATAFLALDLLDGRNPQYEKDLLSVESLGISGERTVFNRKMIQENYQELITSSRAWKYIKPYVFDSMEIDLYRVN